MICRNNLAQFKRNMVQITKKSQKDRLDSLKLREQQSSLMDQLHQQVLSQTSTILRLQTQNSEYRSRTNTYRRENKQLSHQLSKQEMRGEELEFKLQRQTETNRLKTIQIEEMGEEIIAIERRYKEQIAELEQELNRARFPLAHHNLEGQKRDRRGRIRTENKENLREKSLLEEETKISCQDSMEIPTNP